MKVKSKSLIILLTLILPLIIILNISPINSKNDVINSDVVNKDIINRNEPKKPKVSGFWNVDFIHIKNDNWSATDLPWIQNRTGTWQDPHIIENVTINGINKTSCIFIEDCNEHFIIRNCTLYNSSEGFGFNAGIQLSNVNHSILIDNNCSYNNGNGILLWKCFNITIANNIANNNTWSGIQLVSTRNNTIFGNTANMNLGNGIASLSSFNNSFYRNVVKKNSYDGFSFGEETRSDIFRNIASYNKKEGIFLGANSKNNIIYNNVFIGNEKGHALSELNSLNNKWDNGLIGNYWDNYTEKGGVDNNNDGIGDVNYTIYNDVGMPIANDTKPIYENPIHNADKIYIDDTGVSALNWSQTELVKWWCEGSGIESDPYIIEDLIIDGLRAGSCILIGNSSVYFEINNCTVYNCSESLFATDSAGIRLINVNNSRIIENNCSYNYGVGIVLFNCNNNNLSNNIANNNRGSINNGIHIAGTLVGSENNTVSQNIANNNTGSGFEASGCYNITFYGNTAKNNTISGISLSASDKSHIINNIIVNNSYNGISLGVGTSNNTILLNTIIDNLGRGILLQDSFDNDIVNNTISSNEYGGIAIAASTFGSLNNNVSRNLISYNDGFGIYIDKNSNNSLIFNNTFIGNQYHAFDNGTNNHWNSSIIGNYWDNYTGEDLIAPYGIGDTPYNIPGVAGSKDYLPINNGTLPTPGPTPPPSDGDDDDDDDDGKDEFDIVEFLTSPTGLSIIGGSVAVVAIIIIIKIKASGKSRVKEIKRIESLRSE